jgi:polar amino acid transport system substrate-binding protein
VNRVKTVCFLILAWPFLQAQKTVSYLVGMPDTQLYPQYWNVGGHLDGYLPRLLRRFAADSKINLELKPYPIRRYLLEFKGGRLDMILPSNPAWAEGSAGPAIVFSESVMQSRAGFISLTADIQPSTVKYVATLAGYTISFLANPNTPFKSARISYVNDVNSAMLVLASKRTDVAYLHFDAAQEWIRMNPNVKAVFHFHHQYSELYDYHMATIRHPQIVHEFNRWLQKNPGALNEIKASMTAGKRP